MRRLHWRTALVTTSAVLLSATAAMAHGFAGKRFFPATLTTDDPFVADELSLPTVSTFQNPASDESPATQQTDVSIDFSKTITPNFGLGITETWSHFAPKGAPSFSGFNNLELTAKYQFFESDAHEFLISAGIDAEVGGTGSARIGADRFSTVIPTLFFGKGLGDLPDSLNYLKPLAVTGVLGFGIPTESEQVTPDGGVDRNPHFLNTGLAIEYSFQYLQSFVEDIGLSAPFNRLIPLVEFDFSTPLDRGQRGQTTGTINPGVIWAGQYFQIGAEALIPANPRTGHHVGAIVQLHFFLDDLFPKTIGKPLFGS